MIFPKISIIIPVFNSEDLLSNCLDSIINQTFDDFEVICIDDGSTDNSFKILKRYQNHDSRFKVFHQENFGAGAARNNAINHANGEYILFVDSDDYIEKKTCEVLYDLAKKLDSDLVLFDAVRHINNGKNLNLIHFSKKNPTNFNNFIFDYKYVKDKVFDGYYGVIWNKFYKSSFIKNNNIIFPNHKIYNDVEFHMKTLILAKRIAYIPKILYHYNRIGQKSLQTSYVSTANAFVFFQVLDGIINFLNEKKLFSIFKNEFIYFCLFELKNKLNSINSDFKQEFFNKTKQFFYSLDISIDDFNQIPFEYFFYYILLINSKNYAEFYKNSHMLLK